MTDQPASRKMPGKPQNCPENHCRDCEYLEDCRKTILKDVDITSIQADAQQNSLGSLQWEEGDITAPKSN